MLFVYVTFPNMEEAENIANYAVQEHLAAGVNIIPNVQSIYRWQGGIVKAQEIICIFKTKQSQYNNLEQAILEKHSYETPCIVAFSPTYFEKNFAQWLDPISNALLRAAE